MISFKHLRFKRTCIEKGISLRFLWLTVDFYLCPHSFHCFLLTSNSPASCAHMHLIAFDSNSICQVSLRQTQNPNPVRQHVQGYIKHTYLKAGEWVSSFYHHLFFYHRSWPCDDLLHLLACISLLSKCSIAAGESSGCLCACTSTLHCIL